MSFFGGGSDLHSYYSMFGGAVLSVTIDKFVYLCINKKFDSGVRLSYSITEEVGSASDLSHPLVKACLQEFQIPGGLEITSIADIPSKGTGLGSSSAFSVALIQGLNAYQGRLISKYELAEAACELEIVKCREPIGKQDQYAASFGGLNFYEFSPDSSVNVSPIIISDTVLRRLEGNILMFYTGLTRKTSGILRTQSAMLSENAEIQCRMHDMVKLAYQAKKLLHEEDVDAFGALLHEAWTIKRSLSADISSPKIDEWYQRATDAGAVGGKLLGAGAGGFMIFYAQQENHKSIISSLSELRQIKFQFEKNGSQVVFYQPHR